jgi:phosphate starvation-inducible PhoH-like protein
LSASDGSRSTTRAARRAPTTVSLAPLDNHALANLCGALDANLRQIEAAYDVAIARRGATFTLSGAPSQTERAAAALQRFYAQASEPLTVDDIQLGLIELGSQRRSAGVETTAEEAPALRTRRADLHGRTQTRSPT